ncbi:MAG: 2OG-Fe(II) oxygenase [Actinomycetota bacterium]
MLEVGERAPDFVLPAVDGTSARFYGRAGGRPTALVLPGTSSAPGQAGALAAAFQQRPDVDAIWIAWDESQLPLGAAGFLDNGGRMSSGLGVDPLIGAVIVLDPNLRVAAIEPYDTAPGRLLGLLTDTLVAVEGSSPVLSQAPVLVVPRVVDVGSASALIAQCLAGSVETGVEQSGGDRLDSAKKRRRDVTVSDPDQLRSLSASVGKRVMPEIQRAFAFRATRFEGFKIAWYDAESAGFFAAHRDNLTPATAHRVFGLSINLNNDYDGGELTFPEYGDARYRAPAGAAMVFSSSFLHAVSPVVRGSRFVLLSFLYT